MKKINLILVLLILFAAFVCATTSIASAITLNNVYVGNTVVDLEWSEYESTDFFYYKLYRDDALLHTEFNRNTTFYRDEEASKCVTHNYKIEVYNATIVLMQSRTKSVTTGNVHGTITLDTIWRSETSPYNLTGTITVAETATLTIEKGVTVNRGKRVINIDGTLAPLDEVTWNGQGLHLSDRDGYSITNCIFHNEYFNGFGIWLDRCNNSTISNTTVESKYDIGNIIISSSNHSTLTGNTVSASIELKYSNHSTLTGNTVSANIYLKYSSYSTLTDNIASDCSGITLYYSNHSTLTGNIALNNSGNGIYLEGSSNCTLTGNTASNNSRYGNGISLGHSSNYNTLTDNTASNNGRYGICLSGSTDCTLTDNTAFNNTIQGIYLTYSSNNTLTGNAVSNNSKDGICLSSSTDCTLTDNTAFNNTIRGIYLSSSSNTTLTGNAVSSNRDGICLYGSSDCTLTDNTAFNNTIRGIHVDSYSRNNTLTGNTVSDSCHGIYLDVYSSNNTLSNNTLSNNNDCIRLYRTSSNTLTGNTVSNSDTGIYLYLRCNDNILTDNNVSNIRNWDIGYGIYLDDSCNNNTLTGNIVSNGSEDGIRLKQSCNCTLTDNIVRDNKYGIYLYDSCNNNTLTGNIASNNSAEGIRLKQSCNCTLTDNTVRDNKYGIYLDESCNNNTFTNNTANSNAWWGIYLYYSSNNNTFTDNTANSNTWCGIRLYDSSNNTFTDNTANSNKKCGICLCDSCNNNTLTDNIASNNREDGICLKQSCNCTLTGNIVRDNKYGIHLYDSSNNTFTSNTANSNSNYGIYLCESCNCTLTSNTANSNTMYGIGMWDSSNNTFTDNTANSNTFYGIHLRFSSNNNTLTNNTADSNDCYGFYLEDGSNNNIEKNVIVRDRTKCHSSWSMFVDSEAENNTFKENTVGSNYPTKITIYDYFGAFQIRGVEDPPKSPSIPEYPTARESISRYVEMQNLSADTTLFISFHYEDEDVEFINEDLLTVWKYEGEWAEVPPPNGVDTYENCVYADISGFSVFAPLTKEAEGDTTPPWFNNDSDNSSGSITAGEGVFVHTLWHDDCALGTTTLQTNQSGSWEDVSSLDLSGKEAWANFTITTNTSDAGKTICWKQIADDTSNNWNTSMPEHCFYVYAIAPALPNITSFAPPSSVSDTEDATRTFNITINQTVNVSWQINGTEVQTNESKTEASYTNTSAVVGTWNVSAIVANANGTDMQTWMWTVEAPSPCYIATATYGTPLDGRIDILRDFRDEVLMTNPIGEAFVSTYYRTSPPIADALRGNDGLRTITRSTLIDPLVSLSKFALNGILLVFIIGLITVLSFRKDRAKMLRPLLVGAGSILVFITAIFALGFIGYTIPFCAVVGAYLLPFVLPLSVVFTVCAVLKMHVNVSDTIKKHIWNSKT